MQYCSNVLNILKKLFQFEWVTCSKGKQVRFFWNNFFFIQQGCIQLIKCDSKKIIMLQHISISNKLELSQILKKKIW